MDGYVLTSDFANIERKLDGVNNGLCDGFYAMNTGMLNGFSGVQQTLCQGFNGINQGIAEEYKNNILIIRINGHLTSCIYGTCVDIWDCTKEKVDCFWIKA